MKSISFSGKVNHNKDRWVLQVTLLKGRITMENDQQIIQYLEEVATILIELQVTTPFYMLITGGAYMLLNQKRRFTEDIDFALVEKPQRVPRKNRVFRVTVTHTEVFRAQSIVPFSAEFRQAVLLVAQ